MATKVTINTELNKVVISSEPAKVVTVNQPSGSKIIQVSTKGPKGDKGEPGELAGIFDGILRITGSLIVSGAGITSSLYGTASWANNSETASYVLASSVQGLNLSQITSGSATASISPTEFSVNVNSQITGSLKVTNGITGSLFGTASWAQNSITASYITGSIFSGENLVLSASYAVSASNSQTASFVEYSNIANKPTLFSGSSQVQLNQITGTTFADTPYTFPNDVVIEGNLTAEQFVISSSVYYVTTSYSSGSTVFGNSLDDTHQFTGSVSVNGGITGSIFGTASSAVNASTASYILASGVQGLNLSLISSGSATASISPNNFSVNVDTNITGTLNVTNGISGLLFGTASWAINSVSSSYLTGSIFNSENPALSASYAFTASYALNAGGGVGFPYTGSALITGSLGITGSLNVSSTFTASLQEGYVWVGGPGNITTLISTSSLSNNGANKKLFQSIPSTTWSFNHNLGERYPVIETYDTNGASIIPGRIETIDASNLILYFDDPTAGIVVATVGGLSTKTNSDTASYVEYLNVANKPTLFSGSSQVQLSGISGTTFAAANFTFPQDLIIQGNLTAEQFVISSSVYYVTTSYSSGSTVFGNSLDDIHQFTGSVSINGNLVVQNLDLLSLSIFRQTGSFWATTNNLEITGSTRISGSLVVQGLISGNFYGDGDNIYFTRVGTNQSADSNLVIGNWYNNYQYNQTTVFRNSNVIVSGNLAIQSGSVLILGATTIAPTPVTGGIYYHLNDGYYVSEI